MDFELNEEQNMVRSSVHDFAQKEIAPVARDNNRYERFPADLVKKMGEMGFLGINIPTEYGGGGAGYISFCVMLEELGYVDYGMSVTASAHISLGTKPILNWGTEAQKKKYLPRLARGEMLGCLATTEANVGSDIAAIETSAVLQGGDWVLNGAKNWISNGGMAGTANVIAQTDKSKGYRGLTAFVVEKGMPGFSTKDIHNKLGARSSNTAELVLEDCHVPQANVLGGVGKGMSVALSAFDSGRIGVAARTVGLAQACLDASVSYSQTRKQFGKEIGKFQLIQEMIAEMFVETEAARLLVYRAAALKDKEQPSTIETSMAKYYAAEAAIKIANTALQIHGAYGYSDDYPVERYYRDVRVSSILEGSSQIQKLILGRHKTGFSAFE